MHVIIQIACAHAIRGDYVVVPPHINKRELMLAIVKAQLEAAH